MPGNWGLSSPGKQLARCGLPLGCLPACLPTRPRRHCCLGFSAPLRACVGPWGNHFLTTAINFPESPSALWQPFPRRQQLVRVKPPHVLMTETIHIRCLPRGTHPEEVGSGHFQMCTTSPPSLSRGPSVSGEVFSPYWGPSWRHPQQEPVAFRNGHPAASHHFVAGTVPGTKDAAVNEETEPLLLSREGDILAER